MKKVEEAKASAEQKGEQKIAAVVTCDGMMRMQLQPNLTKLGYTPHYLANGEIPSTKCEVTKLKSVVEWTVEQGPALVIFYPTTYFGINNGLAQDLSQKLKLKCRIICLFSKNDGPTGNMSGYAGSWNIRYIKLNPDSSIPKRDFIHAIDT